MQATSTTVKLPAGVRFDSSDALMIATPGDADRKILFVNPAFARLTGFAASEWIGRSADLLLADGPLQMESLLWLDAGDDGREVHWIARLHRRDGTPFTAEAHVHPITTQDGRIGHVVVVINDVTDRVATPKSRACATGIFEMRKTG